MPSLGPVLSSAASPLPPLPQKVNPSLPRKRKLPISLWCSQGLGSPLGDSQQSSYINLTSSLGSWIPSGGNSGGFLSFVVPVILLLLLDILPECLGIHLSSGLMQWLLVCLSSSFQNCIAILFLAWHLYLSLNALKSWVILVTCHEKAEVSMHWFCSTI